jgi:hypothetical protein
VSPLPALLFNCDSFSDLQWVICSLRALYKCVGQGFLHFKKLTGCCHIRVLWQLFTQNDVPPPVAGTLIDNFQKRFESSDDVQTQVVDLISKVAPASVAALAAVTAVQSSMHMGTSQIAKDTKCIDQDHLLAMFTTSNLNAGLSRWAPDVLGAVESMYNALHEQLALSTFKNVAASFGYMFMNIDLLFLQNHTFLVKLYQNFVFGYMAEKACKDGKAPGHVAKDNDMVNVYRHQNHVRVFLLLLFLRWKSFRLGKLALSNCEMMASTNIFCACLTK